jgi:hypothetical protein
MLNDSPIFQNSAKKKQQQQQQQQQQPNRQTDKQTSKQTYQVLLVRAVIRTLDDSDAATRDVTHSYMEALELRTADETCQRKK